MKSQEIVSEGVPPPNGLGAVRRGVIPPLRLEEEITAFERPSRLDYRIRKVNLPFRHEGASIRLHPDDGRTRVEWHTSCTVPIALLGGTLERAWVIGLRRGLRRILEDVDRLVD